MNNFYSFEMNLEKDRAIGALSTILQDESLQLTVQADKKGDYFFIKDKETGNTYGQTCVDGYHFDNLEQVSDAFEELHQNCFFDNLDTRCDDNNIEFGDYDAAVGYLLTSNEFRQILRNITPNNWNYPIGVVAAFNQTKLIDFAEKLLCKEILKTMNAYALVEVQGVIFLSVYGVNDVITRLKKDSNLSFQDLWNNLASAEQIHNFFTRYTSYAQLLKGIQPEIIENFDEIGSDLYLNKPAMCLMGLSSLIKAEQKYASQQVLKTPLSQSDKTELFGQIIDIFEDFLDQKNVTFENDEREDSEDATIIFGTDYDVIVQKLEGILEAWHLI